MKRWDEIIFRKRGNSNKTRKIPPLSTKRFELGTTVLLTHFSSQLNSWDDQLMYNLFLEIVSMLQVVLNGLSPTKKNNLLDSSFTG